MRNISRSRVLSSKRSSHTNHLSPITNHQSGLTLVVSLISLCLVHHDPLGRYQRLLQTRERRALSGTERRRTDAVRTRETRGTYEYARMTRYGQLLVDLTTYCTAQPPSRIHIHATTSNGTSNNVSQHPRTTSPPRAAGCCRALSQPAL